MRFLPSLQARAAERPRRLVFPEGSDPRTLAAVVRLQRDGMAIPLLLGDPAEVERGLVAAGGSPGTVEIRDPGNREALDRGTALLLEIRGARGMTEEEAARHAADPLMQGALLVREGVVEGSVAGAVGATADVLRAALWCVGLGPGNRTISSSFYMVVPPFRGGEEEVLTFTDCGVVPEPGPRQLAEIALAAARARSAVVGDAPRVAFLSYSTKGSAEGARIEKVREALDRFRRVAPGIPADGEFQADAALVPSVARQKAPGTEIPGDANVLVFPSLEAGNIAYKLVQRLAHAEAIGPIVQGLRAPCNDLSRGASIEDIVHVACITALMCAEGGKEAGGDIGVSGTEGG